VAFRNWSLRQDGRGSCSWAGRDVWSHLAVRKRAMLDVILIVVGSGCFAVAIAYAYACDRL
jgi:hypothetical protein